MNELNRFVVLSFADLKKYHFYYWIAYPAIAPPQNEPILFENERSLSSDFGVDETDQISKISSKCISNDQPLYVLEKEKDNIVMKSIEDAKFTENTYLVIASSSSNASSWSLRNILVALQSKYNCRRLHILQLKVNRHNVHDLTDSTIITVTLGQDKPWTPKDCGVVGWERYKGKLTPRFVNLSNTMDSVKLASAAVDLNLKLMKWRLSPSLDLDSVQNTKCLLLGAGTLGCNVSRNLLSWGVRHISFVDYGKVSYSNPVRQWLYTYEDSKEGKQKATTAAERLKTIFPEVVTSGHEMTIPMPGHIVKGEEDEKLCLENVEKLSALIDEHDVIFLLLDSREARWLPTLLSTMKGKIVFNVALGFDNFVIMRHGVHYSCNGEKMDFTDVEKQLGCYFCNDVIAPTDTMKFRTLDQQCTVTRPGISSMASSIAVELLISLLHHPEKQFAPSEVRKEIGSETSTELGIVPHQIRGYLSYFANMTITGYRYDKCVACSDHIIENYKKDGTTFLLNVFNNPKILEDVTGITEMKEDNETDIGEWSDDDSFSL